MTCEKLSINQAVEASKSEEETIKQFKRARGAQINSIHTNLVDIECDFFILLRVNFLFTFFQAEAPLN